MSLVLHCQLQRSTVHINTQLTSTTETYQRLTKPMAIRSPIARLAKYPPAVPYTAHATTAEVRLRAGSPPQLLPLIQTRRLRFFGHVARMGDSHDTPRALYTSIRGLPKDWRRRPGRPRRTWLRTMEADLQPLNLGLKSAWRLAQDRERWKQLMETATLQSGACLR